MERNRPAKQGPEYSCVSVITFVDGVLSAKNSSLSPMFPYPSSSRQVIIIKLSVLQKDSMPFMSTLLPAHPFLAQ